VAAIRRLLRQNEPSTAGALDGEENRHRLADRLLLATKWMFEGQHRHGKTIMDRFHLVLQLRPNWDDASFELARYLDLLICGRLANERYSLEECPSDELIEMYTLVIEYYGQNLRYSNKYAMQALPRLLTLWTTFCTRPESIPPASAGTDSNKQIRNLML